jgi:hypothetical protein
MNTLILHIGSHKTGTSSVQRALFFYKDKLRACGISPFFEEGVEGEVHSNLGMYFRNNVGRDCNFDKTGALIKAQFYLDLATKAKKYKTVIVSSEEFSFVLSNEEIARLKEKLIEIFDEIKIIVYLRRQDKQLISHHQQASRAPGAVTYLTGNQPVALPAYCESMDPYFDYYQRLGRWGDVFGDDALIISNFNSNNLVNRGIVADFFSKLEVDFEVKEFMDNASFGRLTTKLKHLSMQVGYSREESLVFNNFLVNDKEKLKPSKREALKIYEEYKKSNLQLISRFGLCLGFFESEFEYPVENNNNWEEEEVNGVIKSLLSLLLDEIRKSEH